MEKEFIVNDNKIYKEENGKLIAEITFPISKENIVNINHTFVDPSLRGQGMANTLVLMALDVVKEKGWKVEVTCPYVVKWFKNNPDKADEFLV